MPTEAKILAGRGAVSIVGIPAILFVSWQGGWWWSGFLMLVAFFGFREYARLTKLPGYFLFLGWVLGLGYLYFLSRPSQDYVNYFWLLAFLAASTLLILRGKVEGSMAQISYFLLGLVYIPGLLGFGLKLH